MIKIGIQDSEEFWLNFDLKNDPVLSYKKIETLYELISDRLVNKEISKETANTIYQELYAINIQGRETRLIGSEFFPKLQIDEIEEWDTLNIQDQQALLTKSEFFRKMEKDELIS